MDRWTSDILDYTIFEGAIEASRERLLSAERVREENKGKSKKLKRSSEVMEQKTPVKLQPEMKVSSEPKKLRGRAYGFRPLKPLKEGEQEEWIRPCIADAKVVLIGDSQLKVSFIHVFL